MGGLELAQRGEPAEEFASEVVARLRANGFVALWAGGCVRDLILGLRPSDYDVATDARAEAVLRLFPKTVPVGISFGVVRVLGPRGAGEVEVATFRSDGCYLDGRRPESVHFGTPQEDAQRRDFTINGMFMEPRTREVIDYVGGRDDLAAGIVRAIGNPAQRFSEDKLRLIRAIRFTARFGFALESATRAAIESMASQLGVVAAERIAHELKRMLLHPSRAAGMSLAMQTGLLPQIFPELSALREFEQAPLDPNAGAWQRTLVRLHALSAYGEPSFPLALTALLADACGNSTPAQDARGVTSDSAAAARIANAARRLRLSNDERDRIAWLMRYRGALWGLLATTRATRKRLLASDGIDELLTLHRADALADAKPTEALDLLEAYLKQQPEGPINPAPLVNGADLIDLGLKPGPRFRQLLERARDAQLEGLVATRDEMLALVHSWLPGAD